MHVALGTPGRIRAIRAQPMPVSKPDNVLRT
jgi:hypothetical protein